MNSEIRGRRRYMLMALGLSMLIFSVLISYRFFTEKRPPRKKPAVSYVPSVEVVKVKPGGTFINIPAMGKITPHEDISIKSEVAGKIIYTSPRLKDGGIFRRGEVILKTDSRGYELTIIQQRAILERAKYDLKVEMGQQDLAKRQWELLGKNLKSSALERELALRSPQLKEKTAALESARASLNRARLDLERTVIRAPFNGIIHNVEVARGDIATKGTVLAGFTNINRYDLILSVPINAIGFITFPDRKNSGSRVSLASSSGKKFTGRVKFLHSGLEEAGKMAKVTAIIEDPLGFRRRGKRMKGSLLTGEYISSTIRGSYIKGVSKIPSRAVHNGETVYLVGPGDLLQIKKIKVLWRDEDHVYTKSLKKEATVIISHVSTPVKGLKLSVVNNSQKGAREVQEERP